MRLGVAVFAVAALVYMLTAPGHLQTEDMRSELAVAQSLVAHGDFTTSDTAPFGIRSVTGRDGRNYSKYGIGDSLLLVPAAAVGHLTHRCAHDDVPCRTDEQRATELVASFLDPLFAALSVTVMFFFAMALGARWAPPLRFPCCLDSRRSSGRMPMTRSTWARPDSSSCSVCSACTRAV
jgi:hypothetical protein